jgi:N-acetylglutamate synthase-like GNAT family acetyltransferase
MIEHSFLIHAICPFVKHQQWDYYTVKIRTAQTVDVHEIENTLNSVRGVRASQESIAETIKREMWFECEVEVYGAHAQNSTTRVII